VICGVGIARTRAFVAMSSVATGQVIGLEPRESCDDENDGREPVCRTLFAPRISFVAADGRTIEFVSSTAESPPAYAEGDRVQVRYPPDRPADAQVDAVTGLWLGSIVTGAITLVLAAISVVFVVIALQIRHA
jgi:hypothetical protein